MSNLQTLKESAWFGFAIATSYGVVSIAITFFNKAVFSVYNFGASNFLTLGQTVLSILFLIGMKHYKFISYNDFSVETARKLVVLGAAFTAMVVTGLAALKYVNVPMYSALRRLTTFLVIIAQFVMINKRVSREEFLSVVAMVVGAMIASIGDLSFDLWGYFLVGLNCVVTAWYLVLISKKQQETQLDSFGLMFYNNIFSIPILSVSVVLIEWDMLKSFDQWYSIGFQLVFFMSCALAFLLNYFVFLCSIVNSPLATSITGQLKAIISTLLGLVMFGGVVLTPSLSFGLAISTFGGLWYGKVKYEEQMSRQKTPPSPKAVQKKQLQEEGEDIEVGLLDDEDAVEGGKK